MEPMSDRHTPAMNKERGYAMLRNRSAEGCLNTRNIRRAAMDMPVRAKLAKGYAIPAIKGRISMRTTRMADIAFIVSETPRL